jgi:hypothetical protein
MLSGGGMGTSWVGERGDRRADRMFDARADAVNAGADGGRVLQFARERKEPRVLTAEEARSLALALPEAVEQDHHGRPSFRVAGKIFATLWTESRMNVMLDEEGILTAIERTPEVCSEVWWGKRLAAVAVNLDRSDARLLAELLADAWEGKAPERLTNLRG